MKLDAARQFQPTQDSVQDILSAYNLALISFSPAQSGIENCTLFVTATDGEYVLRVYRRAKKSDSSIAAEIDFIAYLGEHGIPVAQPIKNALGGYLTKNAGWQSILMPKIKGVHARVYDSVLVNNVSAVQSKMHQLAAGYDAGPSSGQPLRFLQDKLFLPNLDTAKLNPAAQSLMERAAKYTVALPEGLPAGLCHLDYDIDNILVNEQEQVAAVLDFDEIAALVALDDAMDTETADKYIRIETAILGWHTR